MGKASSSKKVARAARAGGGRRPGQRRHLAYPMTIVAIVVAGVALVAFARSDREARAEPRANEDHWHAAYGIYVCDAFQAPLSDAGPDTSGIHTHDEGVIHIHPFADGFAGANAQLGVFLDMVGLQIDNKNMTLPDGTSFEEGTDTCGEGDDAEEGRLVVARWASADEAAEGLEPSELITKDFDDVRFRSDREAYTIAFVAPGADIPPPESIPGLDNLSDVVTDDTDTDDTVPGDDETTTTTATSETTLPEESTTTSAP